MNAKLLAPAIATALCASASLAYTPAYAAPATRPAQRPHREAAPVEEHSFLDEWISGRLSIGLSFAKATVRHRHVTYDPAGERNFLGNINDMQEHGDTAAGLVIRYNIAPWLAIEGANDFRADLDACNMDGDTCDGTLKLRSWRAQAILTWPDETWIVRPWAGIGFEDVSASFDHSPWWHYGWSSPADYSRYGGDTTPRNGVTRTMHVEDPGISPILSCGITAGIWENLHLDIFARWTDCDDVSAKFVRSTSRDGKPLRTGAFPAEHVAFGAALRYEF